MKSFITKSELAKLVDAGGSKIPRFIRVPWGDGTAVMTWHFFMGWVKVDESEFGEQKVSEVIDG